jgi:Glycosyltransferase family 87
MNRLVPIVDPSIQGQGTIAREGEMNAAGRGGEPGAGGLPGMEKPVRHPNLGGRDWFRASAWVLGLILLGIWCLWWVNSVRKDRLVSGQRTWIPVFPTLACDFIHNLDHPSRVWVAGGDPYKSDAICISYPYPPLVPRLFAWSSLLTPERATVTWLCTLSLIAIAGAWTSWKARDGLGIQPVPLPLVLVAVLFSTPVMFAIERGNCDLLVLLFVLAALRFMKSHSWFSAILAGILFAAAAWSKVYPGLLLVGLVALRQWRVLLRFLGAGAAIGLADLPGFARFVENNGNLTAHLASLKHTSIHFCEHSLSGCWPRLWADTPLARIPGTLAALVLLMPLLLWISVQVYRCPNRDRLAYAYLVLLLAFATFVPTIANDYNLIYLPLAILAVWDERDPVPVHIMLALLSIWWQPFRLPIDGKMLFVFKCLGLLAATLSLSARAREQSQRADGRAIRDGVHRPHSSARGRSFTSLEISC